jgi:nucleoside diphosphate kinase
MHNELAHVMLKPDTLLSGLREVVLRELEPSGGHIVANERLTLSLSQIGAIYPDFPNPRAKPFVFAYFTSRETEHFAFVGGQGLHSRLNEAKGETGTGKGIRGKYYTYYTRLSQALLDEWLCGTLPETANIDLEMFGRDILHVAATQADSLRGIHAIMGEQNLRLIRERGFKMW